MNNGFSALIYMVQYSNKGENSTNKKVINMGMFDEVTAVDVTHENFDNAHNGLKFQTKDLECEMFEYRVSGNQLLIEAERGKNGYVRHENPIKNDFSGECFIYTDQEEDGLDYWIEYDLIFESGLLVDVTARPKKLTQYQKNKLYKQDKQPTGINNPLILDEFHLLAKQIIESQKERGRG